MVPVKQCRLPAIVRVKPLGLAQMGLTSVAVCGIAPVDAVVPVLWPGAYHTGILEGSLLYLVSKMLGDSTFSP